MTLNGQYAVWKRCVFWSQLHKFEEDSPILSAAKM